MERSGRARQQDRQRRARHQNDARRAGEDGLHRDHRHPRQREAHRIRNGRRADTEIRLECVGNGGQAHARRGYRGRKTRGDRDHREHHPRARRQRKTPRRHHRKRVYGLRSLSVEGRIYRATGERRYRGDHDGGSPRQPRRGQRGQYHQRHAFNGARRHRAHGRVRHRRRHRRFRHQGQRGGTARKGKKPDLRGREHDPQAGALQRLQGDDRPELPHCRGYAVGRHLLGRQQHHAAVLFSGQLI